MKKIKGIQILAKECHTITNGKNDVGYCKGLIEITVDFTDSTNTIVTKKKLEKLLEEKK